MLNQCTFIGNLAADPTNQFTKNGNAVSNFTVCVDVGWGDKKETEFVRCVAWSKLAEICGEYLHKGSKVFVQGEMKTRSWEDKEGVKRYTTEINVQTMKMLSPKESNPTPSDYEEGESSGDSIPF